MAKAVALDFGASSARYGLGEYDGSTIQFEIIRQIHHEVVETETGLAWDLPTLVGFCREAVAYAETHGAATVGIDTWGVDLGLYGADGKLLAPPVCYRDPSHEREFVSHADWQERLYDLTGIQHQPFNTVYQLLALAKDRPDLVAQAEYWQLLPDLLAHELGDEPYIDLTHASTTQLLGLDGKWSPEVFSMIGWPVPSLSPQLPGTLGGEVGAGVRIAHVGGHDTASAVAGFGDLPPGRAFANLGTWSLVGVVVDEPITSDAAKRANLTNERTVDGRVRLLKNVPGFYVINRVFDELKPDGSVVEWLSSASSTQAVIDLQHPELFNPSSMLETVRGLSPIGLSTPADWAGLLLNSLGTAVADALRELSEVTGVPVTSVIVGGGGSHSLQLRETIARLAGVQVVRGAAEATVLGNLAVQFLAQGVFADFAEMYAAVARSTDS